MRENDALIEDSEGEELPDLEAARSEALAAAREIVAERIRNGRMADGTKFEIADEKGRVLAIVPFADVLSLP